MKVTEDIFLKIISLYRNQPWLENKDSELQELLYSDCIKEEERKLVFNLINSFFYMKHSDYINHINTIAEEIINNYSPDETLICASTMGRDTDSAQEIVYILKSILPKRGGASWARPNILNNLDKSIFRKHCYTNIKNIFVLDEFNGSGKTIRGRHKKICDDIKETGKKVEEFYIKFFFITSISDAYKTVTEAGINLDSKKILPKGITENTVFTDKESTKKTIKNLSYILSDDYLDNKMFHLGYKDSEALYCRENGNTPNSVFPLFWWPKYNDNSNRKTLLCRGL